MRKLQTTFLLLLICCTITKSFGQSTTLAGGNIITSNISPIITNASPAVSNPTGTFSLVQTTSNANLTQVSFSTTGTYSAVTDITAFSLYVNTLANSITGSTLVPSATVTATGAGTQTIVLSTPYSLSTATITYYFFIVPTMSSSAVPGHTIGISSISSSNITVSAGSVSGSVPATGTLTILNPAITGTTSASRCGTGTVVLGATATTGATINWYNVSTAGTSLGTGTSYTTAPISATTPYYAEASNIATIQTGTLSDNTTNLVGPYYIDQRTDLHWFSSTNAVTINSVDIYPAAAVTIVITMTDSLGDLLASATPIAITAAQVSNTVPVTVPLGFAVPAGATKYRLGGDGTFTLTQAIYRGDANSTYGPYPMTVDGFSFVGDAGGNSTATGTSGAFTGYGARCYFYNWNITMAAAAAPRSTVTATVNPVPTPTFTTAPGANSCIGNNVTYTTQASQSSYAWSVPGALGTDYTISSGGTGSGSNSVTLTWLTAGAKTVTVNYSNGLCTGTTAATSTTTVNALPVPTFTASPGANTCAGTSVTYTTQTGQSGYTWSVPGISGTDYTITSGGTGSGSNSASLTWLTTGGKTVTVNYSNSAGCAGTGAASNTTTVNALPVPTFTSSPGASTCAQSSVTYATQAGQSSYVWSVPGVSGTNYTVTSGGTGSASNMVTLTWLTTGGKTVTVNYANSSNCAGATPASNTTTVNSLPVPTFTSSAGANTCAGSSVTYTTQAGQSSYTWGVPGTLGTDYTVTSGGTGSANNTVTLYWTTPGSKTVTVNYTNSNSCAGTSAASNTTTVNAQPVPAFTSSPGANTCAGSSVTYTTQSGQSSYTWSVPGISGTDYSITSGGTGSASSTVTLNWITPGSKTVTVNYTNISGCTGASPASAATSVNLPPAPSFSSSPGAPICANSSVTYTTQAGEPSYTWSVPGVSGIDYTITSGGAGSDNNTVTLTWMTAGSKTVTVNYTDENGCTGLSPASNAIIVNALPVPTFTASPEANICSNGSATYTTQAGQSSYSWTVPGTPGTDYNITSGGTGGSDNTVTLTWITPGSVTVSVNYTDVNGCTGASAASNTIVVNPLPDTIAGAGELCRASTITLSDDSTGGTWTSGNTLVAVVDPSSGDVTGILQGTAAITYTLATGCTASAGVTVNPLPNAISGNSSICIGSTTALSDPGEGSWMSSDGTVATIDMSSGVITGLMAGTPTITYTLPVTGCALTASFTVNPLPAPIAGITTVCTGSTTNLSDANTGGTWISSAPLSATVNLTSGQVTGLQAGSPIITYTLPTGCNTTANVIVNPSPAAISGGNYVCLGSAITLTDASTGGLWTSSNGTVAVVIGGVVNGTGTGTATIAYMLPAGCFVSKSVTVNPAPSPIGGTANVCNGATTSLTDADSGGSWTSSNTAYGTIGSSSGIVTANAAGMTNITYKFGTGCSTAIQVTVNPSAPITGITQVCTGATTTLSNSVPSGTWTSSNTSVATVDLVGHVTGITAGLTTITYSAPDGCVRTTVVPVNTTPAANLVTGGGNICAGSTGAAIGLSNSDAGVSYQLLNGTATVGGPLTGTGGALNFGLQAVGGVYTIVATNPTSGCSAVMSGTAPVTVRPLPVVFTVTGGGAYCAGSGGLHVGLSGSNTGISYQLFYGITHVGLPVSGTGLPLDFGAITADEVYTVVAINDTISFCSDTMAGNAAIVTNPLPAAYSVSGGGHYCASGTGVHVGLAGSNAGINYQLYNGASSVGTPHTSASGPIDFGLQTAAGTYTVLATNAATLCTVNMASSVTVVIDPMVVPSVSISTGTGDICSGSILNVVATPVNGGVTPVYSWSLNGMPVSVSGDTYSYLPSDGDHVSVVVTSNAPCASPTTAANSVILSVLPSGAPGVHISVIPGDTICQGTLVDFSSAITFGGAAPTLTWLVNGSAMGGSGGSFSYTPANHDAINCILSSNYQCRTADSGTSNTITMQVAAAVDPVVTVSANPGLTVSPGETVTFTASAPNAGPTPSYQWYENGLPVPGANSSTFTGTGFSDGDSVLCRVTSSGLCPGLVGGGGAKIHITRVGVQQIISAGSDIRLAPNPNKGIFTVKGTLGSSVGDEEVTLVVTDMLGQVVYSNTVTAQNGILNETLSLNSSLANGMYLLNVRSGGENAVFHFVMEK